MSREHSTDMSAQSTTVGSDSTTIDSYRVLCKGCKATQPLEMFLHKIDATCYRVNLQCRRCLNKSNKHWRAHREDIKAARAARERDTERITCVCGISISARYRVQHCQSKRHLSVVAVLRQHNALSPNSNTSTVPASTPQRKEQTLQEEVEAFLAATEQQLAAEEALREQRRSLLRSPESSTQHITTTALAMPPLDLWMMSGTDSAATPWIEPGQSTVLSHTCSTPLALFSVPSHPAVVSSLCAQ